MRFPNRHLVQVPISVQIGFKSIAGSRWVRTLPPWQNVRGLQQLTSFVFEESKPQPYAGCHCLLMIIPADVRGAGGEQVYPVRQAPLTDPPSATVMASCAVTWP